LNVRRFNLISLAVIVLPLVGVVAALALAWNNASIGAVELGVCGLMFAGTFIGVEVGYHRHFAHCSFHTSSAVRHILGALGSMACQGSVIWWTGIHRSHHHLTDTVGDPHSPMEGFYQAHMGWLLSGHVNPPGWTHRVKDLIFDPLAACLHRRYPLYALLGLAGPAVAVAMIERSWYGLLSGFLWGGLVRIFLVNHITWSTNSICHRYGRQPYPTHDASFNNYVLMLPSLGLSLHNNHHAFPAAATTSHAWWQVDVCGLIIRLMEACGLVWNVSIPSREKLAQRRTNRGSAHANMLVQHSPD
jgi:stearoyl-CoA desaturase (delta-9 desaturase)